MKSYTQNYICVPLGNKEMQPKQINETLQKKKNAIAKELDYILRLLQRTLQ